MQVDSTADVYSDVAEHAIVYVTMTAHHWSRTLTQGGEENQKGRKGKERKAYSWRTHHQHFTEKKYD